jgi:hypothetical protein
MVLMVALVQSIGLVHSIVTAHRACVEHGIVDVGSEGMLSTNLSVPANPVTAIAAGDTHESEHYCPLMAAVGCGANHLVRTDVSHLLSVGNFTGVPPFDPVFFWFDILLLLAPKHSPPLA